MRRLWRWLQGLTDDRVSEQWLAQLPIEEMPEAPMIRPPKRETSRESAYSRVMIER